MGRLYSPFRLPLSSGFHFLFPQKADHSVNLSSDHKPSFLIELLGEFHAAGSEFPLQAILSNDSLSLNPTTVALKWSGDRWCTPSAREAQAGELRLIYIQSEFQDGQGHGQS